MKQNELAALQEWLFAIDFKQLSVAYNQLPQAENLVILC